MLDAVDDELAGTSVGRIVDARPDHRRARNLLSPGRNARIHNRHVDWDRHQIAIPGAHAKGAENRRIPFDPQGRLAPILKRRAKLGPSAYVFGGPSGEFQDSFKTAWESPLLLANGHDPKRIEMWRARLAFVPAELRRGSRCLGVKFSGVLARDGWAPYRRFVHADHQTCLAHLLRRCRLLQADHPRSPFAARRIKPKSTVFTAHHDDVGVRAISSASGLGGRTVSHGPNYHPAGCKRAACKQSLREERKRGTDIGSQASGVASSRRIRQMRCGAWNSAGKLGGR